MSRMRSPTPLSEARKEALAGESIGLPLLATQPPSRDWFLPEDPFGSAGNRKRAQEGGPGGISTGGPWSAAR